MSERFEVTTKKGKKVSFLISDSYKLKSREEELKKEIESHYYSNSSGDELACYCEECKRKASELKGFQEGKSLVREEIIKELRVFFNKKDIEDFIIILKRKEKERLQELKGK